MNRQAKVRIRTIISLAVGSLISACANRHVRDNPDEILLAALLESDSGINLEEYAIIGNELEWAGNAGRAAILKRHKLTEAEWNTLGQTFDLRMSDNRLLFDYYEAAIFRVAKGQFAIYGRDLADSYTKGGDLKLHPPLSIDDTGRLNGQIAAIWKVLGLSESERLALKATTLDRYGLSSYDYTIVNGWWLRKAQVAEIRGDHSIMRALVSAESEAASLEQDWTGGSESFGSTARDSIDH